MGGRRLVLLNAPGIRESLAIKSRADSSGHVLRQSLVKNEASGAISHMTMRLSCTDKDFQVRNQIKRIKFTRATNPEASTTMAISERTHRTWEFLLDDLCSRVPGGAVRKVFDAATGQEVNDVGQLHSNCQYMVTSGEKYAVSPDIRIRDKVTAEQVWLHDAEKRQKKVMNRESVTIPRRNRALSRRQQKMRTAARQGLALDRRWEEYRGERGVHLASSKPVVIQVIENGLPEKPHNVVLSKRNAPTFSRALEAIGDTVGLAGGVRKLYTLPKTELVRGFTMLFGNKKFVAVGLGTLNRDRLPHFVFCSDAQPIPLKSIMELPMMSSLTNQHVWSLIPIHPPQSVMRKRQAIHENKIRKLALKRENSPKSPNLPRIRTASPGNIERKISASLSKVAKVDTQFVSERNRQREAHRSRVATVKQNRADRAKKQLEAYESGSEKVDAMIATERSRQKAALYNRLGRLGVGSNSNLSSQSVKENGPLVAPEGNVSQVRVKLRGGGRSRDQNLNAEGTALEKKSSNSVIMPDANDSSRVAATLSKEDIAATKIQATYRGYRTRVEVKALHEIIEEENKAATKIQANYRGYTARKEIKKRQITSPQKTNDVQVVEVEDAVKADSVIQDGQDGKLVEEKDDSKILQQKTSADTTSREQRNEDMVPDSKTHMSEHSDQESIVNKKIPSDSNAQREGAAIKIQAGFRGHKARRRVASLKRSANRPLTPAKITDQQLVVQQTRREESHFSLKGIASRDELEERYDIGKKLGEGNFAEVRYCELKANRSEKFAMKIIDRSKTKGAKESKMIENEIKIMKIVDHENCVKLYDVYETKEHIYLLLEFLPDGDLFDRIVNKGRFKESGAVVIMKCMASAIFYLHSRKIIHRDLKPENVLMYTGASGAECVKLADFGLSMKVTKPLKMVCGTPTYVAPEVISAVQEGYGLPVDMWALGVILYIVLCGFPPFASPKKNQRDLFKRIQSGHFKFPSPYWDGISSEVKHLISGLLRVDQNQRYSSRELVKHPWLHGRKLTKRSRVNSKDKVANSKVTHNGPAPQKSSMTEGGTLSPSPKSNADESGSVAKKSGTVSATLPKPAKSANDDSEVSSQHIQKKKSRLKKEPSVSLVSSRSEVSESRRLEAPIIPVTVQVDTEEEPSKLDETQSEIVDVADEKAASDAMINDLSFQGAVSENESHSNLQKSQDAKKGNEDSSVLITEVSAAQGSSVSHSNANDSEILGQTQDSRPPNSRISLLDEDRAANVDSSGIETSLAKDVRTSVNSSMALSEPANDLGPEEGRDGEYDNVGTADSGA